MGEETRWYLLIWDLRGIGFEGTDGVHDESSWETVPLFLSHELSLVGQGVPHVRQTEGSSDEEIRILICAMIQVDTSDDNEDENAIDQTG